jgi:RecJ-like exonuclease
MSRISDMHMDPPGGYGAFDEEQLNERIEDIAECELCNGKGSDECISDCCGEKREPDLGLCYYCHDHCGPSECPDCNGTGIIKTPIL